MPIMSKCLTKKSLFREISSCLVEKPECGYARKFGFSFVCLHPEHENFHAHVSGTLTREEANILYETLKQKRRAEFLSNLDETSREYFCLRTDFRGQPLTNVNQNERSFHE